MKHAGYVLTQLLAKHKKKRSELAAYLGIHDTSVSRMLNFEDMQASKMEKICNFFGESPLIFFELTKPLHGYTQIGSMNATADHGSSAVNSVGYGDTPSGNHTIELYERMLQDKEKIISEKERQIVMLLNLFSKHMSSSEYRAIRAVGISLDDRKE